LAIGPVGNDTLIRLPRMTTATTIPIINLGDSDDDIISTLERALSDRGLIMVQGHGVSEALLANLRQLLATYFAQPLETN
jgi:isopenicillin N synthase-like dioxygenase